MCKVGAVIVAGGSGKRMGTEVKKQYICLQDKEILAYAVEAFQKFEGVDEIVVVVGKGEPEQVRQTIIQKYGYDKVIQVVEGGKERQDSVLEGLKALGSDICYVMIHDGARPFITQSTIIRALEAAQNYGASVVAVPVKDTIKVVDENTNIVQSTPKRSQLWSVQTPQSFKKAWLMEAYQYAEKENIQVTDDSMLVEAYGKQVHVVMGDYNNIKITTPEDLNLGKQILMQREVNN